MAANSSKAGDALNDRYPLRAAGPVGKPIPHIQTSRLASFISTGQYESQNLLCMLDEARITDSNHVKLFVNSIPDLARPTFSEATASPDLFKPTSTGKLFGPSWATHWFRIHVTISKDLLKKDHLEFNWDARNEGLVWSEEGVPLQGLTGGGRDQRTEWILPNAWRDGKEHVFYIEMACNKIMGNASGPDDNQPPAPDTYFRLEKADIVAVNVEARSLYIDFRMITDAASMLSPESWESHQALQTANAIMDAFRPEDQGSITKCRQIAATFLGDRFNDERVYESGLSPIVYGIGHCHIDTCWLWPWAETKRKVARSWSNQCDLMDRFPEHRFTASQAVQYKWLEEFYPALYDRVKAKVKERKFQPIGGSWVEHDTNMPGGESLIRQFLYGQRFFESHFGERCTTFWLPDTFGYSGQLPQLCRLAGMSRFFTQKLSWNNINKFPHTTFNWVALDGSQVLCHMAPSEKYNSECDLEDLRNSITQHKSLDVDATSLLVFGYGDGGGGPTWEHLEKLRRCRGISDQVGQLSRATMGLSVDDFFAQLQEKVESSKAKFATWYGELYFELHRGTYTTQANNKRNNRKSEILLHDIELLATIASIKDSKFKYPKADIDEMWEAVLLCQFHDCLPGSSIGLVYDESDALYKKIFGIGEKILCNVWSSMGYIGLSQSKSSEKNQNVYALNTLPWRRTEVLRVPTQRSPTLNGPDAPKFAVIRAPEFGLAEVEMLPNTIKASEPQVRLLTKGDSFILSNDQLSVTIENGCITSLIDNSSGIDKEIIPKGERANQFVIFDDKPLNWQAWDVEVYHLNSRLELPTSSTHVSQLSPHLISVTSTTQISASSWIKSTISLSPVYDNQPSYISIETEVEWRESMKFLKVEFPVNITSNTASYETQFGVMNRPTHYNTTWDMAKFEVCCHKWADLSEHNFGISILNDSKYGFATCGNLMRLSLLRAPKAPDANADMGRHHVRYAILPHTGPLSETTVRTAFNFNNPMRLLSRSSSPSSSSSPSPLPSPNPHQSPIRLTGSSSLILDTIKRSEDDADIQHSNLPHSMRPGKSVIVRIYDSLGGEARGTIEIGGQWDVKRVWKCNILEDDGEEVEMKEGEKGGKRVEIVLRAFEVATYRLQL